MNQRQALREARKRWGKNARVERNDRYSDQSRCMVGRVFGGMAFEVKGSGPTFAAAFRDHDTKGDKIRLFNEAKGQPCPVCSRTMQSDVYTLREAKRELGDRKWGALDSNGKSHARYMHWPTVLEQHDGSFHVVCSTCTKMVPPC